MRQLGKNEYYLMMIWYHNGTVVLENKSPSVLKIHTKLKMKLYFGFDIIFKIISESTGGGV